MKSLISLFIISSFLFSPSLEKVRIDYVKAVHNKEITIQLNNELSVVSKSNNKTLVAYKGAVLTLMAKFASSTSDKKKYFKEGATLLDYAVSVAPNNIEIRTIRLGVQENSPRIVGYRAQKEEDKNYILKHYKSTTSNEVKAFVKNFALQSITFSEEEKLKFK